MKKLAFLRDESAISIGHMIGVLIVILIGVSVVIPVTNEVIQQANVTGTTATLLNLIPVLIAVALIVGVVLVSGLIPVSRE